MKISVESYGPIAEAKDIEFRPLTVFVGPSNTGKSYLAILMYAVLNSFTKAGFLSSILDKDIWRPINNTELSRTDNWLKDYFNGTYTDFSNWPEGLKKWTAKKITRVINHKFHEEMSRCMGTSKDKQQLLGNEFNLHFEDSKRNVILKLSNKTSGMELKKVNTKYPGTIFPTNAAPKKKIEMFLSMILINLFGYSSIPQYSYLPAARTGIMQSYRAIAGSLVQRTTQASFEPIPTLSGVVSDFLVTILFLNTTGVSDSDVEKVARKMEKDILSGVIKPRDPGVALVPQFLYEQNGLKIPLLRSSAMVSELAPVILFLKHRVKKGDLLIIEEPEAHLHPEAQRKVATAIVRLIRAGVRVIVTTHSSYVLEQLANHVRLSKLNDEQRSKLTGGDTPLLKETEIAAYSFQRRKAGTIVKSLPFDEDGELSPKDHNRESSDIYNQSAKLQDAVEGN